MSARSRRILVAPAAVVAGLVALTAFGVAPKAAADTTSGEAGYAVTGGKWTSVSASWVQPTANCAGGDSEAALWLGLDGIGSTTLEQTGTEMDCSGGVATYYAWYEMYPAAPVYYNVTLRPGDHLSASVTSTGQSGFTLTLRDDTQGWLKTTNSSSSAAQLASAEIVAEVPTSGGSGNSVSFTQALVNGAPLGSSDPQELDSPGMTVSPIGGSGEQFTVSW